MRIVLSLLVLVGFVLGLFLWLLYMGGISPRFLVRAFWAAIRKREI